MLTVAHLLNSKVKSVGYEEYDQGTKQQKGGVHAIKHLLHKVSAIRFASHPKRQFSCERLNSLAWMVVPPFSS